MMARVWSSLSSASTTIKRVIISSSMFVRALVITTAIGPFLVTVTVTGALSSCVWTVWYTMRPSLISTRSIVVNSLSTPYLSAMAAASGM